MPASRNTEIRGINRHPRHDSPSVAVPVEAVDLDDAVVVAIAEKSGRNAEGAPRWVQRVFNHFRLVNWCKTEKINWLTF